MLSKDGVCAMWLPSATRRVWVVEEGAVAEAGLLPQTQPAVPPQAPASRSRSGRLRSARGALAAIAGVEGVDVAGVLACA